MAYLHHHPALVALVPGDRPGAPPRPVRHRVRLEVAGDGPAPHGHGMETVEQDQSGEERQLYHSLSLILGPWHRFEATLIDEMISKWSRCRMTLKRVK